jgi:hypothetical protein
MSNELDSVYVQVEIKYSELTPPLCIYTNEKESPLTQSRDI